MKKSGFYIIKEQFFEDMNEPYLKGNKKENRPHYYCFEDENTGIYWMIPLSSKIEKYRKIMEKREAKGKTCDILHILRLDDKRESVFLIQDMFPITEQYIEREYKWDRSSASGSNASHCEGVGMLGDITAADEIYIVTGRTDMRKSIDGLCAVVEDQLHMDPRRSALYLFCGKRCDRIKALLWESGGFVLLYKRMEVQGRFRWPRNQLEVKQLTCQQFDWLMSGLEIEQPKAFKPTE